jgi:hypothetical protein
MTTHVEGKQESAPVEAEAPASVEPVVVDIEPDFLLSQIIERSDTDQVTR